MITLTFFIQLQFHFAFSPSPSPEYMGLEMSDIETSLREFDDAEEILFPELGCSDKDDVYLYNNTSLSSDVKKKLEEELRCREVRCM